MAVHKEHTVISFPSFPAIEDFEDDDDDYENNFVICLEDNGDEDDCPHVRLVGTSVPNASNSINQGEDISRVAYPVGAEGMSKVPSSSYSSDAYCRDTSTYSESQVKHLRSNVQPEPQSVYSSATENMQCIYKHSFNGSLFSHPRLILESKLDDPKITLTTCSNNINGTTAVSKLTAGTADSHLNSENVSAHNTHLEDQDCGHQRRKSNVSQPNLSASCSESPRAQLETIHFDQEAGGIWTEAVFLNTTEMSDFNFTDFGDIAAQNNGIYTPVSNNSIVPKLAGPYPKLSSPDTATDCNVRSGSAVYSLSGRVLNENVSCSCIMCYKGQGNLQGCQKSQTKEPRLTKAEKLSIFKKPANKKKLTVSVVDSAEETSESQNVNTQMTCPQVLAVSVNNALSTRNVLSYVASPLKTTSQISLLGGFNSSRTKQLGSPSHSDVAAQKVIIVDMSKQFKPANTLPALSSMATDRAKTSHLQPLKLVTAKTNADVSVVSSVPEITSIPKLSSHPTKLFPKPTERSDQKSQAVSPAAKLNSGSPGLPSSGQTSAQMKASCKEASSKNVSSTLLSSHPNNNVVYVSSDHVYFYPHQTRAPVSILPVNKQAEVKASNASRIAVIQLPTDKSPNKVLQTDSVFKACHQNRLNQNSVLHLNTQNNLNSPVKAAEKPRTFQLVLNDTANISGSEKVISKPKQPDNNFVTPSAQMHTSQVITAAGRPTTSPVSTGSVLMRSLLQARGFFPSAQIRFSDARLVNNTKSGDVTSKLQTYLTSKLQTSPGLGPPQKHLRLKKPVIHQRPLASSDKTVVNLFPAGLRTPQSSPVNSSLHNAQFTENATPKTDTQEYKSPPERDKPILTGMLGNLKKVSSPHLPQEGLPSTYIEDWVSKTTTFVSEQFREDDCIPELSNCVVPSSNDHSEALLASQDDPKSVPLEDAKGENMNHVMFHLPDSMETIHSKPKAKNQLLLGSPTCADFQKPSTLQVFQSDSPSTLVSSASSVNTTHTRRMDMQEHLDRTSNIHRPGEKLISSAVNKRSQEVVPRVQNIPLTETLRQISVTPADTHERQVNKLLQASTESSSSILNSSNGIKLKIKLGTLRNEKTKEKQSADVVESSVRNAETVTMSQSPGGSSLKEVVNINADILACDSDKQNHNADSRIETAEEMFQRFQEQAVREVVKAQMGMGYVSRSLRPTRTTMAFLDKYPYRFGPGKPKKKGLSEKNVCAVSVTSGDSNYSKIDNLTETSGLSKEHKQPHVRNKRQMEEVDKECKSKQSKLSLEDYPRLKQDCSIAESKTVYCTNILAGHKVYVKFNTFENMCSERAFLVPFFNIGGSRTQFDVEDMEYINRAVIDFESEDRSCARHLLFYSRAGNKAVFLRKETNLQASHLNDKNYKKCSFVLEGFKRSAKKLTETSPEHWKVDNMVDIEIDRAEIDNDIETEFDTNISLDEVLGGPRIADVSALPSQDRHLCSVEKGAHRRADEPDLLNTGYYRHETQTESGTISEMERITETVPVTSELSDSLINSDQTLVYAASHFQGSLIDIQHEEHLLCSCAVVKEEDPVVESDAACTVGQTAWIKKEKMDVNDEESIQRDSSHPVCYMSSENSSPSGDHILDNIFIKNEPPDDYFNSLEETEPCLSGDSQIEVPRVMNMLCSPLTHLSAKLVNHHKLADHALNFTSEEILISATGDAAHVETSVHSQLTDLHNLQNHITKSSATASDTHVSKLHFVDGIVPVQSHARDDKVSSLVTPFTSTGIGNTACGRNDIDKLACDVDEPASVKTTSIIGPSLPESPLPSSSMSCSSEILPSSEIEDMLISSESDFSVNSHALVAEVTGEDEDQTHQQNIVQNKITSLVESLRHRLTQGTSSLPPWIASSNDSTTETREKKRKMAKVNVKKNLLPENTAQAQTSGDFSSSVTETCSTPQTVSTLYSPVPQSVSYSIPHKTSLLPSPSTSSACLATTSLPLNTSPSILPSGSLTVNLPASASYHKDYVSNHQIMPLPEKVAHPSVVNHMSTSDIRDASKSDYWLVDGCTLNMTVDKVSSELEDDGYLNRESATTETLSGLATCQSDLVGAPRINSDLTACSETLNPNRQSPVDFEIEIGNEDLPETALSLQLILPSEDLDIEALKLSRRKHREYGPDVSSPGIGNEFQLHDDDIRHLYRVNNLQKDTPASLKERRKAQHSKGKNSLFNTKTCINDYHIDKLQVENETRQNGSVASYLCKKFSFQGNSNIIKGPRLLNMPSNRKPSISETSKQKATVQSTFNAPAQSEPITTDELMKTPSLDEIFGATVNCDLMADPENKMSPIANCDSKILVKSNSKIKQKRMHQNTHQAHISRKKRQNRTDRKNVLIWDISDSMATAFQPDSVVSMVEPPLPDRLPLSVNKTESSSEVIPNLNACKVVLTRLDLSSFNRLSENVFLIRKEAAQKERPSVGVTNVDSDTSQANSSKPFKRIFKKKGRRMTRPGFRRRGDVIDYYAYMLETLQKKALQLEEETKKKEGEELAKKLQLKKIRCEEVKELEQLSNANAEDELVAKPENMNSQETDKEMEVVKNSSSKEVCGVKEVDNCISKTNDNSAALEAAIDAVSTNDKDEPTLRSAVECDPSEKPEDSDAASCVRLNAGASQKDHEACVDSEVADVSDSNWPYLQKFCDEAIFSQGNIDYLHKVDKDICFPGINEGGSCELKFEKKDIVLCSSANEQAVLGELSSCETFGNIEDTGGCIEQCTDEQEIENMDDDGILLSLKLKQSSEFSCDDQETRKRSFSQSPTDLHISSLEDGNIVDANCKSGDGSSDNNSSSAVTVKQENAQSLSVSCQIESSDPVTDDLDGTSNSSTTTNQAVTEHNITPRNEKSVRNVDISPSWERLLGHNSMDIINRLSNDASNSHPETPQNHDVSFVASSNFKLKFKLPKGILSKALQLSRDMNKVFEDQTSDETNNSEVSPQKSFDEISKNSSDTHICRTSTETEDIYDCVMTVEPCENKTQQISQIPISKLKFSSATLNAFQKAKAEFLQKRTAEKNGNEGSACENITNKLDGEQAGGVDLQCNNGNTLKQHWESADDNNQKLSDNVSNISNQEKNELSLGGDLHLNEGSKQFSSNNVNVDCKENDVKIDVHAKAVSVSELVCSGGDLTTNSALPSLCSKQRKDGIFSNLDLFQEADALNPACEQSLDKETLKETDRQSSNKEVQADNISKVSVIDIRKLKLKLNPLLGKLKGNAENSISTVQHSAPVSSTTIEKFAQESFYKLQQKLKPYNLATQKVTELIVHTSQPSEECTSVAKTVSQHSGLESAGLLDLQGHSCEADVSSAVKQNGHISDRQDAMSQPKPVNSSSEISDKVSVSTCKQFSQVNTIKLCTILKNFHKTSSNSNSVPTNPEGVLLDSGPDSQDDAGLHIAKQQRTLRKSNPLNSASKTTVVEANSSCKTRGKRKKSESEKHETVTKTNLKRAKKIRQNVPTNNCVPEAPYQHLLEGQCSIDQLDSEDKGERSFFDCLSAVPLDVWE